MCGVMTLAATASDDVGVVGVQFRVNGVINLGGEVPAQPYSVLAFTDNVANGSYTLTAVARDAAGNQTTSAPVSVAIANPPQGHTCKFIPTFLVYYGPGRQLVTGDAPALARFDGLDTGAYRYFDMYGRPNTTPTTNTWTAIRAINPYISIFLYKMGAEDSNFEDDMVPEGLTGIDRYNVSRGHSMGSLNGNHPELFLRDSEGNLIYDAELSKPAQNEFWYLMDFGSATYQSYWVEAVLTDLVFQPSGWPQPWVADGVFADNCLTVLNPFSSPPSAPYTAIPPQYNADAAWSEAMNNFVRAITAGLHAFGQRVWCNRDSSQFLNGFNAWLALDAGPNPPDVVAEEGAFAVSWGSPATQFFPEESWKRQVDVMGAINRSSIAIFSHTTLAEGMEGIDNWGMPVTFWQTLWYSLGSFLLGRNDVLNNAYFQFAGNGNHYDRILWYDEYDMINLGRALGPYTVTPIDSGNGFVNVYWREFEKGYVYVNPDGGATNPRDVSVHLPQTCTCRQLTHENLNTPASQLSEVTDILLKAHTAAIVLKTQ